MKEIVKRYGIGQAQEIQGVSEEVQLRRKDIEDHLRNHQAMTEEMTLYQKFVEYDKKLAELILVKRFESGISTLIFFLYSILAGIAGAIMEILALLTTTGLVGHVILSLSITGAVVGIVFALYSMKRERTFIIALKEAFQTDFQNTDAILESDRPISRQAKSPIPIQKL
ncbi:MAG: hypothetical protein ACP5UZ_04645 [Thermoplasmata archaeon]